MSDKSWYSGFTLYSKENLPSSVYCHRCGRTITQVNLMRDNSTGYILNLCADCYNKISNQPSKPQGG